MSLSSESGLDIVGEIHNEQPGSEASVGQDPPSRNDKINPAAIVVLLLVLGLQSSFLPFLLAKFHHSNRSHLAAAIGDESPPADLTQEILQIDSKAKLYYCAPSGNATAFEKFSVDTGKPTIDPRQDALKDAQSLLAKYPNEPSVAERIIL